MRFFQFLVAFVLAAGLWSACKDVSIENPRTTAVTFAGQIIDENNQPIAGALVQAGNESVTTDANGVFRLPKMRLPENDARLQVRRAGYFEFSRAYILKEGAVQPVTIQLLAKTQVGTLSMAQGGMVQVPGGPSLSFPANSVNTASGSPYSGTMLVYAHFIDPSAPDLALRMPGDLRGINAGGEEQSLGTYGMLAVEITGAGGEALKVAEGSTVEMTMPIDASQLAGAPATIPLWYFDLEKARWIEEGAAQKIGSQYVGQVKHFSCWNYDSNYPSVILHGTIYAEDLQHPLAGATVWVGPANLGLGWGFGHGNADQNGYFGGAVPQGVLLRIEVLIPSVTACGNQAVYSQNIGPFNGDVTLPPIIVSNPALELATIKGRLLDCNNQPVSNGYAKITLVNGPFIAFTLPDGSYEANVSYCSSLGSNTGAQVVAYDLNSYLESIPQTFNLTPGTISLGDLPVCNMLSEFISYTLDGQSFTYIEPGNLDQDSTQTLDNRAIYVYDAVQNSNPISLFFQNNRQPGIFPLSNLAINSANVVPGSLSVSTTVTAFGAVGEPIIGTFGGTYEFPAGTGHSISGSYRVIRH